MENTPTPEASALLEVCRGNPNPEELAAVTALLTALGSRSEQAEQHRMPVRRVARLRKRHALSTPRLSWNLGRR